MNEGFWNRLESLMVVLAVRDPATFSRVHNSPLCAHVASARQIWR
jgi:hypothetical protein